MKRLAPNLSSILPVLRRHAPFAVVAAAGLVLRVLAAVTYAPALMARADSYTYLFVARHLYPGYWHPAGYPLFLWPWVHLHAVGAVPWLQHALGLLVGFGIYVLLRRLGIGPWLAALGAAPVLLDAYQVALEQFVMSEALFEALLVGAVILVMWRRRPSIPACAAAGALVAWAAVTRVEGLVLVVPLLTYLVARRTGGVRLAATVVAFLVPLGVYASWYDARYGHFAVAGGEGYQLYGRVMPFADCSRLDLPRFERVLCDPRPEAERGGAVYYVFGPRSPLRSIHAPGQAKNALVRHFALRVIAHQPAAYAATVLADIGHYFAPGRSTGRRDEPVAYWQFARRFPVQDVIRVTVPAELGGPGGPIRQVRGRAAGFLHAYQRFGYTPGPLLALALALGLLGLWGARRGPRPLRAECFLFASTGALVLLAPAMTVQFDYRYLVPALAMLPPAGVLGFAVLTDRLGGHPRWRRLHLPLPGPGTALPRQDPTDPAPARLP